MIAVLYLALTVGACWAGRRLGMPILNGISAFVVPWSAVLCLATLPSVMRPTIGVATWAIIFAATVALIGGVAAGWLLGNRGSDPTSESHRPAGVKQLSRWHWTFVASLASYFLLQVARLAPVFAQHGGWRALTQGDGSTLKQAIISATAMNAQTGFGSAGLVIASLGYVLFLGNLSLFTGVLMLRARRPVAAVAPLVVSGIYSVVSLQRTTFMTAALVMGTSWFLVAAAQGRTNGQIGWRRFRHTPKPVMLAGVLTGAAALVALLYPLAVRNAGTRNPKGLASLANYVISGVAGLNVRAVQTPHWSAPVVHGVVGPLPGWGAYTFSGFFSILARAGIRVPQAPTNLDFQHVTLFGKATTTNVNTNLGDYYLDFNWAGVVVLSFALALMTGYLHRRYVRSNSLLFLPGTAYLLASSLWSFFTAAILGDFRYVVVATVGAALLQRALRPRTMAPPGARVPDGVPVEGEPS